MSPGGTLAITLTGSDPENSALTFDIVTPPTGGLTGSGPTYTYTAPAQPGTDLIVFTANDGSLDSAPAGIFITVGANRAPTPDDDTATTDEDEGVSIPVIDNDTDPDGDTLTVTGVGTAPMHGTAACSTGGCSYLGAPDFFGEDEFTYLVADGRGGTASATVTVTVDPVNDRPDADDVTADATAGTVTLHATDVDSTSLTFEVVDPPTHGTLGTVGTADCTTVGAGTTCTAAVTYTRTPGDTDADTFTYRARDGVLNSAVATVTLPTTNPPPTATVAVGPSTGTAPLATTIIVGGSDDQGDPLTYTLDFGDGTTPETGSLPAAASPHTYTGSGLYTVRLAVSDGVNTTVDTATVSVGLSEPLTAQAGDNLTATVGETVSVDGAASRPLIGIETYSWDFGDGSPPVAGVQATHSYATSGDKTVTLTVTSGAATSTDTLNVAVSDPPALPGLRLTVTGDSTILAGADVAVINSEGVRYRAVTDATGVATIDHLPDGRYTAYAIKAGYRPGQVSVTISGGTGAASLDLESGAIAQTEMTSTRLTYQEIIDAGIDPNDPQNQNVFEFEVHLAFGPDQVPLTFSGLTTGGGFYQPVFTGGGGGGGGCSGVCTGVGGYTVYPTVQYVGSEPSIVWMIVPGRAKWLKEFFEVQVLITNLAEPAFTFENGQVGLGRVARRAEPGAHRRSPGAGAVACPTSPAVPPREPVGSSVETPRASTP